jgi:2,3,4,5-tetrahydropyridine-2-carboxylate N-succinyltransferase
MNRMALGREIDRLAAAEPVEPQSARSAIDGLWEALEAGDARAAEKRDGVWVVNPWVKRGILLAFRVGRNVAGGDARGLVFRDRDTLPTWDPNRSGRDVRIVPGGTAVRRGAYLADGVVVMPPAYVNVGAYLGRDSMIDSHALVGSCAQVGRDVHLSAAVQLGGVLEPIGALPVIIEDDAFIGGNCGIFEGTRVGHRAVIAPGVILSRSVSLYDLVNRQIHRAEKDGPLVVPEGAVVVPGTRPATGEFASERGIQLQTPVIVKYRDSRTDAALALEETLR